ncbi:MAG TPA: multiheme c-type cytochrome [Kofleriaceae bacterium]|nr:multiheme c-type cytochrome [Kofleriaceae bacterium]
MAARTVLRWASWLTLIAVCALDAHASRRDWTGSAACGACHPAELAAWQATPHARTRERFASRPEPRCLGCHATGEAPAGPAIAVEVGCEACHGAGAAYAPDDVMRDRPVARALGLADLSTPAARAALCATCHRTPSRGTPFDAAAPVHPVHPARSAHE